jgi:hypothetical protein
MSDNSPLPGRRPAPNNGAVISPPAQPSATERRVLAIDIPAGVDDELASMAAIVATVEALPSPGRRRVLEWAYDRYIRGSRLRLVPDDVPERG